MPAGRSVSPAIPPSSGKTILLNTHRFTIVGVAPAGFVGTEVAFAPEFWVPLMMAKQIEPGSTWLETRMDDNLFVIGRLKPGVTVEQAKAQLDGITGQMAKEYPKENAGRSVLLMPPGLFIPDIRNSIFAFSGLLAVVGALVLLLACVNLANLLLARATERRKEIGIRLAVGASRARLVRQLLTESVMLSLAGGAVGLLLATWTNHLVEFDQVADRHRASFRSSHRLARPRLYPRPFDSDRDGLQPHSRVAIVQTRARARIERRKFNGGLSPFAPAQCAGHRAGRAFACPVDQCGIDRAQSAGRATHAAGIQSAERGRAFL